MLRTSATTHDVAHCHLLTLAAPLVQHLEQQLPCNQSSQVWLEGGGISVSPSLSGWEGLGPAWLRVPRAHGAGSEGVRGASGSRALASASSSSAPSPSTASLLSWAPSPLPLPLPSTACLCTEGVLRIGMLELRQTFTLSRVEGRASAAPTPSGGRGGFVTPRSSAPA